MLAISFLALLWLQLVYALHPNWMGHSYYDFGWVIPPVVIGLVAMRWRNDIDPVVQTAPPPSIWLTIALFLVMLVPLRIIEHVDPFWRLPLWLHATVVLVITHLTIAAMRGRRASLVLLPATLLVFLAVPLPSALEHSFVRILTDWVSACTEEILPFAGYPVERLGHSFLVGGEWVDVAKDCSGIRSFQSCLAAGFVLGELMRLSLLRRSVLLGSAILFAVLLNSARVLVLVRATHEGGREGMNEIHDQAGMVATTLTYFLIGILAWVLDRRDPPSPTGKKKNPKLPPRSPVLPS
jgi:exosortase